MAEIILITGGSRSGKSDFAQEMAESLPGPRLFLATCPVADKEMQQRIQLHKNGRDPKKWDTTEELIHLDTQLIEKLSYKTVLIDCLTLWINNLMYYGEKSQKSVTEDSIRERVLRMVRACRQRTGTVIMVTNEVGQGIVPDNAAARIYRDLVGRCNQSMGREADRVFFVSCGIPLQIKPV